MLFCRSYKRNVCYLPGGMAGIERKMSEGAIVREIMKEANVALNPSTIKLATKFTTKAHDQENKEVNIKAYFSEYAGELKPMSEIEEFAWLNNSD